MIYILTDKSRHTSGDIKSLRDITVVPPAGKYKHGRIYPLVAREAWRGSTIVWKEIRRHQLFYWARTCFNNKRSVRHSLPPSVCLSHCLGVEAALIDRREIRYASTLFKGRTTYTVWGLFTPTSASTRVPFLQKWRPNQSTSFSATSELTRLKNMECAKLMAERDSVVSSKVNLEIGGQ